MASSPPRYATFEGRRLGRGPALTTDSRATFKDSYAPATAYRRRNQAGPRAAASVEDPAASHREQQLVLELQAARAEIQQLRNALRVSATALQHATTFVPPEFQKDMAAQGNLLTDLSQQVRDADDKVLLLSRKLSVSERLVSHQQMALKKALVKWCPSGEYQLRRLYFEAWREVARQGGPPRRYENKAKQLRARAMKSIATMFEANVAYLARSIFMAWIDTVRLSRKLGEQDALTRRRRDSMTTAARKVLASRTTQGQLLCVWSEWKHSFQMRKKDRQLKEEKEKERQADLRGKRASVTKVLGAIVDGKKGTTDKNLKQLFFVTWKEHVFSEKAQSKLEGYMKHAEEMKRKMQEKLQEQAKRKFILIMGLANGLSVCFMHWRDFVKEAHVSLTDAFAAWRTLARTGRGERELEKEREKIKQKEKDLEMLGDEKRKAQIFVNMSSESMSKELWLRILWQTWVQDTRVVRLKTAEKLQEEEWQRRYEEYSRQQTQDRRKRNAANVMVMRSLVDSRTQEFRLRYAWSAWFDVWRDAQRQKSLDLKQQLFEAERRNSAREDEIEAARNRALGQRKRATEVLQRLRGSIMMGKEQMLRATIAAWKEFVDLDKELRKSVAGTVTVISQYTAFKAWQKYVEDDKIQADKIAQSSLLKKGAGWEGLVSTDSKTKKNKVARQDSKLKQSTRASFKSCLNCFFSSPEQREEKAQKRREAEAKKAEKKAKNGKAKAKGVRPSTAEGSESVSTSYSGAGTASTGSTSAATATFGVQRPKPPPLESMEVSGLPPPPDRAGDRASPKDNLEAVVRGGARRAAVAPAPVPRSQTH